MTPGQFVLLMYLSIVAAIWYWLGFGGVVLAHSIPVIIGSTRRSRNYE